MKKARKRKSSRLGGGDHRELNPVKDQRKW